VEEPEVIFNRIAGLDDSMFGNLSFNNHALFTITNYVVEICNEVSGKNNKEIADAMSALSRKNVFMDALLELSKGTEFAFHVHKVQGWNQTKKSI
jgi:hypothetical protein